MLNKVEILENLRNGSFTEFIGRIEHIYDYIAFTAEKEPEQKTLKELDSLISVLNDLSNIFDESLNEKVEPFNKKGIFGIDL